MDRNSGAKPGRKALVLSGGGARGAYEAGVLSYLFGDLASRMNRKVRFDIVTGTSVGAVHACYIAGSQELAEAAERLASLWRSLSLERVFPVGTADLFRVPWRLLGFGSAGVPLPPTADGIPSRLPGLFDTGWLESIVLRNIPWQGLRDNIAQGRLEALAIAATEIATGRSVVFIDNRSRRVSSWSRDRFVIARPAEIGPGHALASAAIPLVFPAIQIDGAFYYDGALRLNTPLAPALRLGADRVLVISLRHEVSPAEEDRRARRQADYSSATYLLGKALNALMLDRVEADLDRLRLFNAILESGIETYGEDFLTRINEAIVAERGAPYRIVNHFVLRPSRDLGELAAECLGHQRESRGLRDWLSRNIVRHAGRGTPGEADLVSYLFFDRCYADHLIALGRRDAEQAADALAAFLE